MATSFSKQWDVGGYYSALANLNTTSTAFATMDSFDCRVYKTKSILLTATSTILAYKVLGSIDGGSNYDITILSSASLADGASTAFQITDYYTNIRIQGAYGSTTGSTGTLSGKYAGISF